MHLVDARDVVEHLVDYHSERHETLTEWLWDRDAIHTWIELLEFLSGNVCKHQSDDVANDSSEEAPCYRTSHEVAYSADEGKVPVVPQVDVDCASAAKQQEHKVNTKADRDDERTYEGVVSH